MIDVIMLPCGFLFIFVLGVIVGRFLSRKSNHPLVGTLFINYHDPRKELMTFRFDSWPEEIGKMRYISFNVQTDDDENSDTKNSQGENF